MLILFRDLFSVNCPDFSRLCHWYIVEDSVRCWIASCLMFPRSVEYICLRLLAIFARFSWDYNFLSDFERWLSWIQISWMQFFVFQKMNLVLWQMFSDNYLNAQDSFSWIVEHFSRFWKFQCVKRDSDDPCTIDIDNLVELYHKWLEFLKIFWSSCWDCQEFSQVREILTEIQVIFLWGCCRRWKERWPLLIWQPGT